MEFLAEQKARGKYATTLRSTSPHTSHSPPVTYPNTRTLRSKLRMRRLLGFVESPVSYPFWRRDSGRSTRVDLVCSTQPYCRATRRLGKTLRSRGQCRRGQQRLPMRFVMLARWLLIGPLRPAQKEARQCYTCRAVKPRHGLCIV